MKEFQMNKWQLIILIQVLVLGYCYGQSKLTISATLLDIKTDLPIAGANVMLLDTEEGASSDQNGLFTIQINSIPSELKISHIAYEDEVILIDKPISNNRTLYLFPKTNVIDEIVVSSKIQLESLSKPKKYSLIDFQFFDENIIRLELSGAKDYRLSISNLEGNIIHVLGIKKIKGIERLYKSCNENHYLIGSKNAFLILYDSTSLQLGNLVKIDTFLSFIEVCKLRIANDLFYVNESHNGLKKNISAYNLVSEKLTNVKSIFNPKQLQNYMNDLGLIEESQLISNITTNSTAENNRIRNIQEDGDFYLKVFYKPEFPIYLSRVENTLLLFNHIDGRLEKYRSDRTNYEHIELEYVKNNKWLKKIITDEISQKHYTLFNHKKGIAVHLIDIETGNTELKTVIESKIIDYNKIKVHSGYLYFLSIHNTVYNSNKELIRIRL